MSGCLNEAHKWARLRGVKGWRVCRKCGYEAPSADVRAALKAKRDARKLEPRPAEAAPLDALGEAVALFQDTQATESETPPVVWISSHEASKIAGRPIAPGEYETPDGGRLVVL